MKRIYLLITACLAAGAAGCCCHGHNSCLNEYDCPQTVQEQRVSQHHHHHHQIFHRRRDQECAKGDNCRLRNSGSRTGRGAGGCPGCPECCAALAACSDAGCDSGDCGMIQQAGFISEGCGCGGAMTSSGCGGGQCGDGGCASGNCGSGMPQMPSGGCASGNCGGTPTPAPTPSPSPAGTNQASMQGYDELQALQAAGWTIMPSPGGSPATTPLASSPSLLTPFSQNAEPVPAPGIGSGTFHAPLKPASAR